MSARLQLSRREARAVQLASLQLLKPRRARAGKADVLTCIQQMGVLQIDTINVVARSPYLVLWSRLGDYDMRWLEQLLAERALFEYWAHEACFVPIADYALLRHRMLDPAAMGWKSGENWRRQHPHALQEVLQHLQQHGAVRAADFEAKQHKGGGWWEWKPQKRALEVLFTRGEVMIARREKFQRVYDLAARVLPDWDDAQALTREAAQQEFILRACLRLGVAKPAWLGDYYRHCKTRPQPHPAVLAQQGLLLEVQVEGEHSPWYAHPDNLALLQDAANLRPTHSTLLSPFDPLVWDRQRALELFDFDYRIECYTPAARRRYGYFCLPLLRRGQLVGRLDAKAHRREGVFALQALHLEPGVKPSAALQTDLARAIAACAAWHGCTAASLTYASDAAFGRSLLQALQMRLAGREDLLKDEDE
ncbi:crosslink repair DNA glycosylase YcaQ family protein [Massilia sp. W12]|uniref:winged helix-turn-helix domain-containing protein n=1 Tax=Massilia sp. W12 TaxID=3126507 RepID=UPI0030D3439D